MSKKAARGGTQTTDAVQAWWWTPARFGSTCAECGEAVPKGATVAYQHGSRSSVCEVCADARGLAPQPSKAFRKMQQSRQRQERQDQEEELFDEELEAGFDAALGRDAA